MKMPNIFNWQSMMAIFVLLVALGFIWAVPAWVKTIAAVTGIAGAVLFFMKR